MALGLSLAAFFISGLTEDRSQRANEVARAISSTAGGPQTFLGPTLAIPYSSSHGQGVYLVFPAQADATLHITTEERRRSLFRVPVYQTDAQLSAYFDLSGVPRNLQAGAALQWDQAELLLGVTDPRGALADATLSTASGSTSLTPADILPNLALGDGVPNPQVLRLFGAHTPHLGPGSTFSVTGRLRVSGAQRLAVLAYGQSTHLKMTGNWPSPGFDGALLPTTYGVSRDGFHAEWTVPFMARGVAAEATTDALTGLNATALGVSMVEVANPYQSVSRSLKYAPLFLSLVFLSFFLFEVTTGRRVHPAQYVLVGIAQIVFYLLLLSFAERGGFDLAFSLAGGATVLLLAVNANWIFASRRQGYRALAIFSIVYTLIYLLLRLEDNALLIGAGASFLAVTVAMYLTRDLDWYSTLAQNTTAPQAPPPPPFTPYTAA